MAVFWKKCLAFGRTKTQFGTIKAIMPYVLNVTRKTHTKNACGIYLTQFGDPMDVLYKGNLNIPDTLESSEVLVKMLMAPINPSDINMIQGTYQILPPLPAWIGNEGVGEIVRVGNGVTHLSIGDWVLPAKPAWGTWRQFVVSDCGKTSLQKIPNDIPVLSAATLSVNPCTAYRMMKDFVYLRPGETIIQNGANSAVGQSVIQLAHHWGINTINVVRDRPDFEDLEQHLKGLGATHVITDSFLSSPEMKSFIKDINSDIHLAFNCVGGKSATELMRHISRSGTMVTYGGMSKKAVIISTSAFIFNDIKAVGFWNTRWNSEYAESPRKEEMFSELCDLIRQGKFVPPKCELFPLDQFSDAIEQGLQGYTNTKKVLVMDDKYL